MHARRQNQCVEIGTVCLPSMAADYDEASIKRVDLWDLAVRESRDDKVERTGMKMQKITKEIRGR